MEQGVVDRYSEDKGFGYIVRSDGEELLVERSSLDMSGYKTLIPGDRVSFDIGKGLRGPEAINVTKI
jgi:CspA family cold shock protein